MNRANCAGLALLVCALLPAAPAVAGEVSYPPGAATVVSGSASRSEIAPGEPVTFTGRGFAPGSAVQLSAEGVPDAVVRADDSGAVVATLTKPAQYAAAGILWFWRIEADPPQLVQHALEDGVYRETGRSGGAVQVTEPVTMTVDLDALFS